jgi:hypothetical protein
VRGHGSRGENDKHAGEAHDPAVAGDAFGADRRMVVAVGVDPDRGTRWGLGGTSGAER